MEETPLITQSPKSPVFQSILMRRGFIERVVKMGDLGDWVIWSIIIKNNAYFLLFIYVRRR